MSIIDKWWDILLDVFDPKQEIIPPVFPVALICLNDGYCPDCGSRTFYRGPEGGASVNIKCAGECGHKFCYCPPFTPQRIDNDDQFYYGGPMLLTSL